MFVVRYLWRVQNGGGRLHCQTFVKSSELVETQSNEKMLHCLSVLFYTSIIGYLALGLLNLPWTWYLTPLRPLPFDDFFLSVGFSCVASFCHAVNAHGLQNACVIAVTILLTVTVFESYALQTGKLFGEYHFEPSIMGPMVTNDLPLIVPFAWYCTLYPCSRCAAVILRFAASSSSSNRQRVVSFLNGVAWVLVSTLFAVASDIVSDPILSSPGGHSRWKYSSVTEMPAALTLTGDFTWKRVDNDHLYAFLGVPLQNFFGWAVTSAICFCSIRILCEESVSIFPPPSSSSSSSVIKMEFSLLSLWFCTGVFYVLHCTHLPLLRLLAVFLIVLPCFLALCPLIPLLVDRRPKRE